MAAQNFNHTVQGETELVADFIRCLECTVWIVYGRDSMFAETPDTLLDSQLQEGLRYDLMREPAISGVQSYKEPFFTAKHEEKCLAELTSISTTRHQYPTQRNISTGSQLNQPCQMLLWTIHSHPWIVRYIFAYVCTECKGGDRTTQRRTLRQQTPTVQRQDSASSATSHSTSISQTLKTTVKYE